jgi:hypothetical protein
MMTDAELEVFLGIAGKNGAAKIMTEMTPEQRALYEKMKNLEMEATLWHEGVGPKPRGVIICGCKRCSPPRKGRKR